MSIPAHPKNPYLEERDEEVDAHHDVGHELVLGQLDVANGDGEAQHLLQLELDRRAELVGLLREVVGVGNGRRELADLGETGTEQTRDLLDERLRGKEGVVLLGCWKGKST